MAKRENEKAPVRSIKAEKKVFPNRGFVDQPDKYPQNAEDSVNTFKGEDGQIYQIPSPVVPIDNAVAQDAPVYNNLPEIK